MESLHRQVLPFILRRLKEDVLQDLPPKIMQDYYCDLSPLQVRVHILLVLVFFFPYNFVVGSVFQSCYELSFSFALMIYWWWKYIF